MKEVSTKDPTQETIRDLLILELAKAGCSNEEIRNIVRVDNNRVSRIAGPIRRATEHRGKSKT
jgi:hypothetical protein